MGFNSAFEGLSTEKERWPEVWMLSRMPICVHTTEKYETERDLSVDVLLTVHLRIILVINQLNVQIFVL
jgi:hypothetical protein